MGKTVWIGLILGLLSAAAAFAQPPVGEAAPAAVEAPTPARTICLTNACGDLARPGLPPPPVFGARPPKPERDPAALSAAIAQGNYLDALDAGASDAELRQAMEEAIRQRPQLAATLDLRPDDRVSGDAYDSAGRYSVAIIRDGKPFRVISRGRRVAE